MSTTLAYHIPAKAVSQYIDYPFSAMCNFAGKALGIKDDGLYVLDEGDFDGTEDAKISAGFGLPKTNMGVFGQKRIRALYIEAALTGDVKIVVASDGQHFEDYILEVPVASRNTATGHKLYCRRKKTKAHYFSFLFENTDGGYFSIASLSALVILLGTRE